MSLREELEQIKSEKKDNRQFGWVVGGVLLLIGAYMVYQSAAYADYVVAAGAALLLLGTVAPMLLTPLQRAWMSFAVVMGFVMSRVILSVIFFLVLTPIGVLGRLFGKAFLDVSWAPGTRQSYWKKRSNPKIDPKTFEKQF
jgi:hypothetical protein